MDQEKVEKLFAWFDETTTIIEKEEKVPYLDGLVEACGLLFSEGVADEIEEPLKQTLLNQIKAANLNEYSKEEIRKALQLAILKGMKGATQQQHYITPDAVAIFMGYLVTKFMGNKKELRIFDPACGSGNLLTGVINQLSQKIEAYGSEVDPTLVELAYMNANLQEHEIELFHQDSLRDLLLEPVDVVVSDLPVGYYPDDENAKSYQLSAEGEQHSYAHHLFIEQALHYTLAGGHLFLLIPNFLFDSDQSDKLHEFLNEHAHIQGILQLPLSMFTNEKNAKSIFILQKKGIQTSNPDKVLMAQLPSFKDVHAMDKTLNEIDQWFKNDRK
ncbi:site-specific DNA-methyltransferase (adenine-specific) [Salinibacillus kushneri]|uniref:Site-specific DNA-methyltransferase (Adenine-specific) n=1 Tax=Salinibacillus kushneri TaxID=237682 RepID=A0A1I0H8D0_9BACI|nr:class I SAM-dependent methyltransferase [Salinibacillus kushneri]SET79917.1 site-specific DNA-methyltransferase (adenine-specific) [Salinibacillus kushneri]